MENIQKVNSHDGEAAPSRKNRLVLQAAFPNEGELQLVLDAAKANGASVSGFVRMAAPEVSRRVLNRHEKGEF